MYRKLFCAIACCLIFSVSAFIGCGDPGPPTGDLSGSVSFNGEVVGDCRVMVYSPTTKRWLGGTVDVEGNFKIPKVPTGEYQIAVGQRTTNAATEEPFDNRIPQKFRDVKTSEFVVSIAEGENSVSLEMTN